VPSSRFTASVWMDGGVGLLPAGSAGAAASGTFAASLLLQAAAKALSATSNAAVCTRFLGKAARAPCLESHSKGGIIARPIARNLAAGSSLRSSRPVVHLLVQCRLVLACYSAAGAARPVEKLPRIVCVCCDALALYVQGTEVGAGERYLFTTGALVEV
jgi:hypothetical protein